MIRIGLITVQGGFELKVQPTAVAGATPCEVPNCSRKRGAYYASSQRLATGQSHPGPARLF